MNKYYIYRYIRLDKNIPFYVGKGKDRRAYILRGRNPYFNHIINSIPYKVEIVLSNLTEEEAYVKEMYFIKLYKSYGMCMANITLGGDGCNGLSPEVIERRRQVWVGRKHTEESKLKMRNSKLGKKRGPHSVETIEKMRKSPHTKNPERNRKISETKRARSKQKQIIKFINSLKSIILST